MIMNIMLWYCNLMEYYIPQIKRGIHTHTHTHITQVQGNYTHTLKLMMNVMYDVVQIKKGLTCTHTHTHTIIMQASLGGDAARNRSPPWPRTGVCREPRVLLPRCRPGSRNDHTGGETLSLESPLATSVYPSNSALYHH